MKNLFLAVAFMFVGTFAFANYAKEANVKTNTQTPVHIHSNDLGQQSTTIRKKGCKVKVDLTITTSNGESTTIEGTVEVPGMSCDVLFEMIIDAFTN